MVPGRWRRSQARSSAPRFVRLRHPVRPNLQGHRGSWATRRNGNSRGAHVRGKRKCLRGCDRLQGHGLVRHLHGRKGEVRAPLAQRAETRQETPGCARVGQVRLSVHFPQVGLLDEPDVEIKARREHERLVTGRSGAGRGSSVSTGPDERGLLRRLGPAAPGGRGGRAREVPPPRRRRSRQRSRRAVRR